MTRFKGRKCSEYVHRMYGGVTGKAGDGIPMSTELEKDAHYAFAAVKLKIPSRILNDCSEIPDNVVVRA